MTGSQDWPAFEALARRVEPRSRLVRTWELEGGSSAQVTALEIERADGRTEKLLVRRHGAADLRRNAHIAADEFRLLRLLESARVPAPTPRYLDADGEIFSTPSLVVDYVEGERAPAAIDGAALGTRLAAVLAQIHRALSPSDVSFLRERVVTPDGRRRGESSAERRIRDVLDGADPRPRRNRPVLLHGDFWPGNMLWQAGRLVAVIDWEDAAIGDPLADVANARLELLWAHGAEAMDDFMRRYRSQMAAVDFTDLPYWDLWADLRLAPRIAEWGLDDDTEKTMRAAHDTFVAQALERLSAR